MVSAVVFEFSGN
ncbi:hypothetical protein VCEM1626_003135A, partial [Vibrio cholerae O1 str. EM-1626]